MTGKHERMKPRKQALDFVFSRFRVFVASTVRLPLLHFALLGIAAFALSNARIWHDDSRDHAGSGWPPDAEMLYRASVMFGIDNEAAVVRQRLAELGQFLDLDGASRGRSLEQQARELGLIETDPVIRRHIEHLAELALQRGGAAVLPTEAEVAQSYDAEGARFLSPSRVRMTQIYFSFERRGAATEAAARGALDRLRSEHRSPADIGPLGDPFVRGLSCDAATRAELERAFGSGLAAAIDAAPTGTWTGPLRSSYGLHLVWVYERSAARPRPLAAVRNQIVHRLAHERSESLAARRLGLVRRMAARQTP